ncbi:hypothetical protein TRFO_40307 [Tritrichomonas foetus]|uniref:RRM domain-containing protein n=1 Tax=Tritrichomonas foetus TaxID=1144522 RepID=A0A1J4J5H4_9EUKA|nr:hypothetical protein TRFO_40307 [Tritrichomonas foetus]|eukprot:OHS93383.1 hypothetical protein TRFO_40307 [Tritrichomonas foetus]
MYESSNYGNSSMQYSQYNSQQGSQQNSNLNSQYQNHSQFQQMQMNKNIQNHDQPSFKHKKPIHTAFFSNIPFTLPIEKFTEFAQQYGEIANMYSLIQKRGLAFVTYYDIRNSQKAVEQANGQRLGNRVIKTNYADKSTVPHRDPRTTCSCLYIRFNQSSKVTIHDVINCMKDYGAIHSTVPVNDQPNSFVVKFCDIRNAQKVMDSGSVTIKNEVANIEFQLEDDEVEQKSSQHQTPSPSYGQVSISNHHNQQPTILPAQPIMSQQLQQSQNYGQNSNNNNNSQFHYQQNSSSYGQNQYSNGFHSSSNGMGNGTNLDSQKAVLALQKLKAIIGKGDL